MDLPNYEIKEEQARFLIMKNFYEEVMSKLLKRFLMVLHFRATGDKLGENCDIMSKILPHLPKNHTLKKEDKYRANLFEESKKRDLTHKQNLDVSKFDFSMSFGSLTEIDGFPSWKNHKFCIFCGSSCKSYSILLGNAEKKECNCEFCTTSPNASCYSEMLAKKLDTGRKTRNIGAHTSQFSAISPNIQENISAITALYEYLHTNGNWRKFKEDWINKEAYEAYDKIKEDIKLIEKCSISFLLEKFKERIIILKEVFAVKRKMDKIMSKINKSTLRISIQLSISKLAVAKISNLESFLKNAKLKGLKSSMREMIEEVVNKSLAQISDDYKFDVRICGLKKVAGEEKFEQFEAEIKYTSPDPNAFELYQCDTQPESTILQDELEKAMFAELESKFSNITDVNLTEPNLTLGFTFWDTGSLHIMLSLSKNDRSSFNKREIQILNTSFKDMINSKHVFFKEIFGESVQVSADTSPSCNNIETLSGQLEVNILTENGYYHSNEFVNKIKSSVKMLLAQEIKLEDCSEINKNLATMLYASEQLVNSHSQTSLNVVDIAKIGSVHAFIAETLPWFVLTIDVEQVKDVPNPKTGYKDHMKWEIEETKKSENTKESYEMTNLTKGELKNKDRGRFFDRTKSELKDKDRMGYLDPMVSELKDKDRRRFLYPTEIELKDKDRRRLLFRTKSGLKDRDRRGFVADSFPIYLTEMGGLKDEDRMPYFVVRTKSGLKDRDRRGFFDLTEGELKDEDRMPFFDRTKSELIDKDRRGYLVVRTKSGLKDRDRRGFFDLTEGELKVEDRMPFFDITESELKDKDIRRFFDLTEGELKVEDRMPFFDITESELKDKDIRRFFDRTKSELKDKDRRGYLDPMVSELKDKDGRRFLYPTESELKDKDIRRFFDETENKAPAKTDREILCRALFNEVKNKLRFLLHNPASGNFPKDGGKLYKSILELDQNGELDDLPKYWRKLILPKNGTSDSEIFDLYTLRCLLLKSKSMEADAVDVIKDLYVMMSGLKYCPNVYPYIVSPDIVEEIKHLLSTIGFAKRSMKEVERLSALFEDITLSEDELLKDKYRRRYFEIEADIDECERQTELLFVAEEYLRCLFHDPEYGNFPRNGTKLYEAFIEWNKEGKLNDLEKKNFSTLFPDSKITDSETFDLHLLSYFLCKCTNIKDEERKIFDEIFDLTNQFIRCESIEFDFDDSMDILDEIVWKIKLLAGYYDVFRRDIKSDLHEFARTYKRIKDARHRLKKKHIVQSKMGYKIDRTDEKKTFKQREIWRK